MKRIRVVLDAPARPACVPQEVADHSIIEVINQRATLERLLDVLGWVQQAESGLGEYAHVERCHPTTSSSKGEGQDNDLVLLRSDGRRARFEVSDVASNKDGNRKEVKDLISLDVLRAKKKGADRYAGVSWPNDALYLVVSREFGSGLLTRKPGWVSDGHCHYHAATLGPTTVLEVRQGRP